MLRVNYNSRYFVLPGYVELSSKQRLDKTDFGRGFDVFPATPIGGILRLPEDMTHTEYVDFEYDVFPEFAGAGIEGGTIGTDSGLAIFERISLMIPCPVPGLAVTLGMTKRPMKAPDVAATVEHSDDLVRPELVVVFRNRSANGRKEIAVNELFETLAQFGIIAASRPFPETNGSSTWPKFLGTTAKPFLMMPIETSDCEVEFQWGALIFAAQLVQSKFPVFDSLHLCGNIESKPAFRRYWTSNT